MSVLLLLLAFILFFMPAVIVADPPSDLVITEENFDSVISRSYEAVYRARNEICSDIHFNQEVYVFKINLKLQSDDSDKICFIRSVKSSNGIVHPYFEIMSPDPNANGYRYIMDTPITSANDMDQYELSGHTPAIFSFKGIFPFKGYIISGMGKMQKSEYHKSRDTGEEQLLPVVKLYMAKVKYLDGRTKIFVDPEIYNQLE
ncbi:CFI-box putative sorting motif-containing protein [Acidithiobacillus sp.]|jgi:hypothetical protein|uniref:CFI-box putative sorting motif-containing protein n=1 Tax=Acidithiobacillus sp. TaxID=1872118 RepID=UPI00356A59F3